MQNITSGRLSRGLGVLLLQVCKLTQTGTVTLPGCTGIVAVGPEAGVHSCAHGLLQGGLRKCCGPCSKSSLVPMTHRPPSPLKAIP